MGRPDAYPAITGIGGVFGDTSLPNDELIARYGLDSTDAVIREKTGIEHRFHASEGMLPSDLGAEAARIAISSAGLEAISIADLYVTTSTPDQLLPSTASVIHGKISLTENASAQDIGAACSGALYGYEAAAAKIIAFAGGPALVVSTELLSRGIDPTDRRSAVLFGDGAAATVIQALPGAHRPVFAQMTHADKDAISVGFGIEDLSKFVDPHDKRRYITMDGHRVVEHAVSILPRLAITAAIAADVYDDSHSRIDWDKIDLFVPHQANLRMLEPLAAFLDVPAEKQTKTVTTHGNTSSASIPLALNEAVSDGRLDKDRPSRVFMIAIGAGMVAKAAVIDVQIGAH